MMKTKDYEDEWILCRTIGHAWDPWDPGATMDTYYEVMECLRCTRCTTERYRLYSPTTGEPLTQSFRYAYPDGYKDVEMMSRREFRAAMFKRKLHVPKYGGRKVVSIRKRA